MTDRDDFLVWVETALYDAELALHNGDASQNANGLHEVDELFTALEKMFSDCTSYTVTE